MVVAASSVTALGQAPATGVTVFEGARVIVGDGRAADRERVVRRERRALRAGRQGRRRARARGCDTREPGRQDGDAGDHRHPHPSEPDARDARRRPAAAGVLRRRGGAEPRSGHDGRVIPGSRADDAGPGEVLHGRPRDHGAGTGAHDRAVLGHDDRGGAQGGAGKRGQEGRHHQDLGRRPHGHGEEALARALQRGHRRSAQERPSRHRAHLHARGCEGDAARRPRRVRARRARQGPRRRVHGARETASKSGPRAEHARSRRGGEYRLAAAEPSRPRSSRRFRRATPTGRTPRRSGESRRATWRR